MYLSIYLSIYLARCVCHSIHSVTSGLRGDRVKADGSMEDTCDNEHEEVGKNRVKDEMKLGMM